MAARNFALTDMQVNLIKAMTAKEIKRVTSLPTGENREKDQVRLSEKAIWLVELDQIIKSLNEPTKG